MDTAPKPKRGLSALLATTTQPPAENGVLQQGSQNAVSTMELPLAALRPNPSQARTHFDDEALRELAASIKARGLIQPIVARQLRAEEISGSHRFEILAGERRWRACQIAGVLVVPVVVKAVFDPRDILLISLVENLQRDDLNPIEEAQAYDRLSKTFNLTHEQIADGVGKGRVVVTNTVRLLTLPLSVQEALRNRKVSIGHAKVLMTIPDPKLQAQLAVKVQAENLTIRDLERLIAAPEAQPTIQKSQPKTRNTKVAPPHLQEVERRLREHFGTKVKVEEGLRKGRIMIEFYSVEDFERIAGLMGIEE